MEAALSTESDERSAPKHPATQVTSSRPRSQAACRQCNHRKVRCDVTRTGIPCSNCRHEDGACEVLPRKKHRPRRPRSALVQPVEEQIHNVSNPNPISVTEPSRREKLIERLTQHVEDVNVAQRLQSSDERSFAASERPSSPSGEISFAEANHAHLPTSSLDPDGRLPDDDSLSYIGDRRGPRRFVYDLCHPGATQDSRPFVYPKIIPIPWKSHETEYLLRQGVFKVPPNDVCDELIRCYFHNVHFFLPVLDALSFLNEYDKNGHQNINPLLFWSMLLAAANFVEPDTLRRAGFQSRKEMKTAMYERAKALYDLDRGTDKLTLIQSVILMGFWYTDPQDHTGAWYWIGIAISLSQNLGLHRSRQSSNRSQQFSEPQESLIRRIWWTCLVRDRWISLAKGRPMRIHQEDCDVPLPVAQDIINELGNVSNLIMSKYLPPDFGLLAQMWIRLVKISAALGDILRTHYRASGPKPSAVDVDNDAKILMECSSLELPSVIASEIVLLHAYQLELFYEATVVVLYRPYVLNESLTQGQKAWQKLALDRARAAASNTNSVLEKIIDLDVVHLLKPMIITTLIPAMQIHLFDCKSTLSLRRGLGENKLNLCMLVLSKLKDTYWSATVIFRLFDRARSILGESNVSPTAPSENQPSSENRSSVSDGTNRSDDMGGSYNQPIHLHQYRLKPPQQDVEDSLLPLQDAGFLLENGMSLWPSESSTFNTVDQLLSPGFSISENAFQSFYASYDSSMMGAYGQMIPVSNGDEMEFMNTLQ